MLRSLVGSEMCIRDSYYRKYAGKPMDRRCCECGAEIEHRPKLSIRCKACQVEFNKKNRRAISKRYIEKIKRKTCEYEGCGNGQSWGDLCAMHIRRKRLGLDLSTPNQRQRQKGACDGPSCEKKAIAKGLCSGHWAQQRKGKPLTPFLIPFTKEQRRKFRAERQRLRKPWDETVTEKSVKQLRKKQSNQCIYCKKSLDNSYHMDHIVPLKLGGPSTLSNLQYFQTHLSLIHI